MITDRTFDVAVVGAGVFGAWSAYHLRRAGANVILLDAYGPGNSRASSGGESRMIRMGYGPDVIYTRMAQRSLRLWQELFELFGSDGTSARLFEPTGILWLARESDPYCEATLRTLAQCDVEHERLNQDEVERRYPQIKTGVGGSAGGQITWAILEPNSGVLMARRAVQAVVVQARALGVNYQNEAIVPPDVQSKARLESVDTISGRQITAKQFVFACGPWLPKIFPQTLAGLIYVTRQEVFFFGAPAGDTRYEAQRLPAWIDLSELVYGLPNLDNRGFKVAIDEHGPEFDPDTGDRVVSPSGVAAVRAYLGTRVPSLAKAPVTESRVCQYENTSNGDFLIDLHPSLENVWIAGGGSGHGFKHGPAVGEHIASLISGAAEVELRFSLTTKEKRHHRKVF